MVLKKVGEVAVLEEAVEHLMQEFYGTLLTTHTIDAVGRPDIRITSITPGNPVSVTITTAVYPAVKLPQDWKKIGETIPTEASTPATDEEIEQTLYTEKMGALFTDQDGKQKPIYMGAYGIGLGRAMGTIVEASHDDKGIIWTPAATPYEAHILLISDKPEVRQAAEKLATELSQNYDVLFDDREGSAGQKFADADLIGIPLQIILGDKQWPKIEYKVRATGETHVGTAEDILAALKTLYVEKPVR
jgi:hypothetical protein